MAKSASSAGESSSGSAFRAGRIFRKLSFGRADRPAAPAKKFWEGDENFYKPSAASSLSRSETALFYPTEKEQVRWKTTGPASPGPSSETGFSSF